MQRQGELEYCTEGASLEEIIVTAERREESLDKVPSASWRLLRKRWTICTFGLTFATAILGYADPRQGSAISLNVRQA